MLKSNCTLAASLGFRRKPQPGAAEQINRLTDHHYCDHLYK